MLVLLMLSIPLWGIALIVMAVRTGIALARGRRPTPAAAWAGTAFAALYAAIMSYGYGLAAGGLLYSQEPEELCMYLTREEMELHTYSHAPASLWPLGKPVCVNDGVRVDLVPGWVNPAVWVFLALLLVAIAQAVRHRLRARREREEERSVTTPAKPGCVT
ncbi:hypothetical protein [Bailinhaonella thermotolerans]|uniref:hypothetical protein n=1 Tax=Bailinhaonella thermotolerans TaxID=1070861 RepID=UPI0011C3B92A|nr:hypothetical protein [Bailinhaonella thermotolerans]